MTPSTIRTRRSHNGHNAPREHTAPPARCTSLPLSGVINASAKAPATMPPSPRSRRIEALDLTYLHVAPQPIQAAANMPSASSPILPPAANDDVVDVTVAQMHGLLAQLAALDSGRFRRAAATLDSTGAKPLTRDALRTLLRTLKASRAAVEMTPQERQRHRMLCQTLQVLARAADAELLLQSQITRHRNAQMDYALPGSQTRSTTTVSGGAGFGMQGAVEARVEARGQHETTLSTGEDLTVATLRTRAMQADLSVQVGIADGVGTGAGASAEYRSGHADIATSMRTHVEALAHASTERRLGGNRLLRAVKEAFGPRRDRYAERTSRALAVQSQVAMLLGHADSGRTLAFSAHAPVPIQAKVSGFKGSLTGNVGFGAGALRVTGEAKKDTFIAALPTRLTERNASGMAPSGEPAIRKALDTRIAALLSTPRAGSPTLALVRGLRAAAANDDALPLRRAAVDQLRSEFDHVEALGRHALVAPGQARPILASLCRDWGSATAANEPVMIGMLDTLAWLQSVPPPCSGADSAAWSDLQDAVQALATRIHDTQLPHDARQVHQATHGFREMTQRVATLSLALDVSAAALPGSLGATASVARSVREDPDPLRAGTYVVLTLGLQAGAEPGAIIAEVQRQWPSSWEPLPAQELLSSLSPTLAVNGTAQYQLRFFTSDLQRDVGRPEAARGFHLQSVRVNTGNARRAGVKVPVPLAPGVAANLGVAYEVASTHTRRETLPASSLDGILLRYQSLCTKVRSNADTWDVLLTSNGPDLARLGKALALPGSAPTQEARYWLKQAEVSTVEADAMLAGFERPADTAIRHTQLFELFEAMGKGTQLRKAASPLLGELTLSTASHA